MIAAGLWLMIAKGEVALAMATRLDELRINDQHLPHRLDRGIAARAGDRPDRARDRSDAASTSAASS